MAIPSSSLIGSSSFPSFSSSSSSCIGSSVAWVAAPCPSGPPLVSSPPRESGSFLCARPSRSFCDCGLNLRGKGKWKRIPAMADSDSQGVAPLPRELAVLLEIEGVLVDFYHSGNRQAFNEAFQKLGLDCANWTDPIYIDLARKSGGDDERMLILFFNKIGWPTSLPTNEKESFVRKILQEKRNALDDYVRTKDLPVRPGALKSISQKLGLEKLSKIKIVGKDEVGNSLYGQVVLGKGVASSLDEQLMKEARKAASAQKQKIAEEVASVLKLSVEIDTTSAEILENIVATLRAGAESAGLPVDQCVLVAGSLSGALAAERIGMPCVLLRSRVTSRAEFPTTATVMEGFGGSDLTVFKLQNKKWSSSF
ncbi:CBBY-like protein isoform X2 [Nymphaea colorata]|uniref:CBBY-like protein isoform X2 n=1 Tax=Nymphaea colorata TaxID=210225 RepID=UPI00214F293B|nr:CBBY-like protein isoform X2 [Nymphaea colorata]